ncbi:MAG: ferrous iron transport protein B [bacterium]|nr:ferrous iron transport protein B [bacterium]
MTITAPAPPKEVRVALVGNPNTGKTTLFNVLTGLNQKVGNYPGVTVERKTGRFQVEGCNVELIDLPGSYSLAARSLDEVVVTDVLLGKQAGEKPVDLILAIIDASNLNRNLYFLSQILELGRPVVVALNMIDVAEARGLSVCIEAMSNAIGAPVVPICASRRQGVNEVRQAVAEVLARDEAPCFNKPVMPESFQQAVKSLRGWIEARGKGAGLYDLELERALIDRDAYTEKRLIDRYGAAFADELNQARDGIGGGLPLTAIETKTRYEWASRVLAPCLTRPAAEVKTTSDRIDEVLTHRGWGTLIFIVIMALVFQSIYSWAGPFMDAIDAVVGAASSFVGGLIPEGALHSLVVDGVFAGVGSVVIFVPQIAILFFFLAILEDCGYLPRAAYLMDRLLRALGLSGKSFIPMISSFACAVPGVMATRTIEDRRDRLVTILVAPLMSCSARLPVYLLFIAAFVPNRALFGSWGNLQGLALLGMYMVGILVAVPVAWIAKKLVFRGEASAFVLEMPSYKWPSVRNVGLYVYERVTAFLARAGTIIFASTMVVWALAYFPHSTEIELKYDALRAEAQAAFAAQAQPLLIRFDPVKYNAGMGPKVLVDSVETDSRLAVPEDEAESVSDAVRPIVSLRRTLDESLQEYDWRENGESVRNSFLGRLGHLIEPAVKPLGWDWRIGMATLASFPAREVIISTLGTIFNLGSEADEESDSLVATLHNARSEDGKPLFNLAVAISIMVFFALCSQCVSTLAVIKRETNSWTWPVVTFVYMTTLAYIGALAAYQIGAALGWA